MDEEAHDIDSCTNCEVRELSANGHEMEVIIPCNEFGVYWLCLSCDVIEFWPGYEPLEEFNKMMHTALYVHCVDALAMHIKE